MFSDGRFLSFSSRSRAMLAIAFLLSDPRAAHAEWRSDGVLVSTVPSDQTAPRATGDGSGGAFVVWKDRRFGYNNEIWAQRLDVKGNPLWFNDVPICTSGGDHDQPVIVSDG